MKIPVPTNKRMFFRQLLELLSSCIKPLNELRRRELDVLAEYMYFNSVYKDVDIKIRHKLVNDTDSRKEMREYLDMSEDAFNNNLSIIKKFNLIDKDNKLVQYLQIIPSDRGFSVEFDFKIMPDDSTEGN